MLRYWWICKETNLYNHIGEQIFTIFVANVHIYNPTITLPVLFVRNSYAYAQGDMHNIHYEVLIVNALKQFNSSSVWWINIVHS